MRRMVAILAACSAGLLASHCGSGAPDRVVHVSVQTAAASDPPSPIALTNGWRYLADPADVGLREGWVDGGPAGLRWIPVGIPNDFNPNVSGASYSGTIGWYELRFAGPEIADGRAWSVRFAEVRRSATVWLNGRELGTSSNPYAPFSLLATTLRPGRPNLLVVRVDNLEGKGSLPEDWWNWGGIVQGVTLEPVGRLSLNDLGVTPELGCRYRCGDLLVEGMVENRSHGSLRAWVEVEITSPSGTTFDTRKLAGSIAPGGSRPLSIRVPVRGRLALWSPSSPALYGVRIETIAGNRVEQRDSLQVGMRGVSVHDGLLYLNGRRLWLRGASIHEDAIGRGAALSEGDIDTIVYELRSLGANITRAHYLLSQPLLDALDAAGIMVWEQAPVDHADAALSTAPGRSRALALLRSTLIGSRSHPSVIVESVGNELSSTPDTTPGTLSYLDQAIPLARRLDPAAAVGLDIYSYPRYPPQPVYGKLDVLGLNSYFGWYSGPPGHSIADINGLAPFLRITRQRYPGQALVISELGAEGLFDGSPAVKGSYEFQSAYLERSFRVLDQLPFMNGAIVWTLRDFAEGPGWTGGVPFPPGYDPDGLDHKGLIAYDGTEKPAFAVAARLLAATPSFLR